MRSVPSNVAKKKKCSIFTFIDAFGWELLQQYPFLEGVLTSKAPLKTVLGYSSTCVPTILTGKSPQEHGHLSFFYYQPEQSPFKMCRHLSVLPKSIASRGRVRHMLSKLLKRYLGYTGYFQLYNMPFRYLPLFDYSEKQDIYQPGGINNGTPTIFDYFRQQNIPFHLSDWKADEEKNIASLRAALTEGHIECAYLYLASMDGLLHAHGTKAPIIAEKIKWYDRQLRELLELAQQKYDDVSLYIFSDHGMADIVDHCDLISQINQLGLSFGDDYAAMYDSTMARFWFFNEPARTKITQILTEESHGDILTEAQLTDYGCNFEDNRYGELFFLMKPGVLICPSFMGERPLAGMHGYDPAHKDSVRIFASNGLHETMP